MKKIKWKISAIFMLLALCFMFAKTEAVKAEEVRTVQCGDNVYATLDEYGILTISGTGDMWDAESDRFSGDPFYRRGSIWIGISEINKVVIEEGVTSIGNYAFAYCGKMTSIEIPNTVKKIGEFAFCMTKSLYEIIIPGSVEVIERGAFCESALKECTLNEGLKRIDKAAFVWTGLNSITIPKSVKGIGSEAFGKYVSSTYTLNWGVKEAIIYSMDVLIASDAFWKYTTFYVEHDSTAETYAKNREMNYEYNVYGTTLTFDPNGGSVSVKSKPIVSERLYGTLPTPTRKNYTFTGWYTKKSGGEKVTADTIVTAKVDSTLYAHWKLSKKTKLTFNANGGKVSTKSKTITYNEKYGTLPKATRKGYTFAGWYTKKSGGEKIKSSIKVTATKNSTLYAHWEKVVVKKMKKPAVISSKSKTMKVSFGKVSGAVAYEIRYSTKANMKSAKTVKVSGKETSTTIKNLKKDKIYYVQIRAMKKDSLKNKIYGKWSEKTKVIIN